MQGITQVVLESFLFPDNRTTLHRHIFLIRKYVVLPFQIICIIVEDEADIAAFKDYTIGGGAEAAAAPQPEVDDTPQVKAFNLYFT